MVESLFEALSKERKSLQKQDHLPDWYTTQGWQLFKQKYLAEGYIGVNDTFKRIANTLARHLPEEYAGEYERKFFNILWKGWLAPSTPVASNTGTKKGLVVSCSGGYIPDSIYGFYNQRLETAVLTQLGFGTSGYLGDIRPRGSKISRGGTASGTLPVFKMFAADMRDVAQGTARRGAWAGYLPIDHEDFYEVCSYLRAEPDDLNIGWCVSRDFLDRLESGDKDALKRYQEAMLTRAITGKGYFYKPDAVHEAQPKMYHDLGLRAKASNLCTEITLHSDEDHTFTCVLSSMNLAKYDEWKDTDAVFVATVFLDCVASEMIEQAKDIPGMEKAVRFTQKSRALGLGALGFHTYLQDRMIPIEGFEAHRINVEMFKHLSEQSLKASQWMAKELGEPEWCKGYGIRNTHRLAVAPNTSSALLCGGVSQGIEPVMANAYVQGSAAGNLDRANPSFIKLLKEKGLYTDEMIEKVARNSGSIQNMEEFTEEEKLVFKTFPEIDQGALLRLASTRQPFICQAQSLNLAFAADEDPEYISAIHKQALLDPNIKSLYYLRSMAGVTASKGECIACEG